MTAVAALPPLREELSLHEGGAGHDGAPTWMLHDPLRNQYFRISWPAFEVLSRWHLGAPDAVARAIGAETTLHLEPGEVAALVEFLARSQLLKPTQPKDLARLLSIHDAHETSWIAWLLHHYLFFRLPLVRPDRMLDALLPYVAWLGGKGFRLATLTALVVGLFLVGRQWSGFAATFVDHFSMEGLAAFGIALGLAKLVHELGHALAAKAFGCRVPSMGVAFLVMMPVLYTDVNDAWKLASRRQRLLIGGAGILAELTLAIWATLAWGLLPEGAFRSMAFTLAATTWVSSLAINLSPFMRFDGYFLAMDALGQPNLHPRSFAMARWHLREVLFKLGEPVPEHLPPATRAWMIAFAWAVWLYRLILFLGIAALVYHVFIKVLGIVLFAVEMGWFVARPFIMEFGEWRKRAAAIRASRRSRWPFGLALLALVLLVAPWSGRVPAPALLKAAEHVTLYAPVPGVLTGIAVRTGDAVAAGTVLARLENPDMALRLHQVERRIVVLKYEISAMGFEESFRSRLHAISQELESALAERAALTRDRDRLTLTAPVAGLVTDMSPMVQPGQWIGSREPILALRTGAMIEAYVAEDDLPRIRVGGKASFIPEGRGDALDATIAAIDHSAVRTLADPQMATPYGGAIPARFDNKSLMPDAAVYRVRLALDGSATVPVRGTALLEGERRSLLGRAFRSAAAVVIREMGI